MPQVRYSEALTVQVQPGFRSLIDTAALRVGSKPTEWARQALTEALRAAGFDPAASLAQQQYALVAAGEIVRSPRGVEILSYDPVPDDRGAWLPIENQDTEPFDPAQHWRLKPGALRVEGARVIRPYQVVAKSQEHA